MSFRRKIIARVLAALVLLASMLWYVGRTHRHVFDSAMSSITILSSRGPIDGPVLVDHSVCRYLLPVSWMDSVQNQILCGQCVSDSATLRSRFQIEVVGGTCFRDGKNALLIR